MATEPMRRYVFRPYRDGMGPHFILKTWDTEKRDSMGKNMIRYALTMVERPGYGVPLFMGDDFACSPLYAIDSVATAEALMTFLTLRPGDIHAEYFAAYTEPQRDFCAKHAEALGACVAARWQDANGNLKARYRK